MSFWKKLLLFPVFLKTLGVLLGDVGDCTVFLLGESVAVGGSVAESSQMLESLEVCGLHKSEIVGLDGENVVHKQPLVLTDELEHGGCLA